MNTGQLLIHSKTTTRHGYTLLELMLALGLSTVLLAAISTSLYGYYSLRDAGERQIDETRNRMALIHQLRSDLSLLRRNLAETGMVANDESNIVDNSATAFSERLLNASPLLSLNTLALYGDANFLAIGELAIAGQETPRSPGKSPLEQRCVIWSTSTVATLTVPYTTPAQVTLFHTLKMSDDYLRGPLANYAGFRPEVAGLQRTVVAIRENPRVLDIARFQPAVESLRFRYHDGDQWRNAWDSAVLKRLPNAVEVTIATTLDPEPLRYVMSITGGGA